MAITAWSELFKCNTMSIAHAVNDPANIRIGLHFPTVESWIMTLCTDVCILTWIRNASVSGQFTEIN